MREIDFSSQLKVGVKQNLELKIKQGIEKNTGKNKNDGKNKKGKKGNKWYN